MKQKKAKARLHLKAKGKIVQKVPHILQNDFFRLLLLKVHFYVPYKFILIKFGSYLGFRLVFGRNSLRALHVIIF